MTCRKTRELLSQRGVEFQERDFFKERLSVQEVRELVGDQDPVAFFSFASPTFKDSGLDRASLSREQLIALIAQEPRYLRRPVVVVDGRAIPGASPRVLAEVLGQ